MKKAFAVPILRFHDKGFPVIRIYQSGLKPGSEAFEFPSSVLIKPDDPMIIKTYSNAFNPLAGFHGR